MQENIRTIIEDMTEKGYSVKEISCFINGIEQGIDIFQEYISSAKMEMSKNETDPLYVHTWNNIVEALIVLTDKLKPTLFEGKEDDS